MKGIVFTEFLEMVEQKFGYETVDHIIEASDLATKGIYTAVGTYPHSEIVQLLLNLSETVNIDPAKLLHEFGKYLFDTFLKSYPQFFSAVDNVYDFLHSIDNHIHVEVLKLYPDATLPKFETREEANGALVMIYQSERKMAALAEGLISKAIIYYGEPCTIESTPLDDSGSHVQFTIKRSLA